jgi:hypothetical protein
MNKRAFEIGFEAGYNDMMKEAGIKEVAGKAKKILGNFTSGITGSRVKADQRKLDVLEKSYGNSPDRRAKLKDSINAVDKDLATTKIYSPEAMERGSKSKAHYENLYNRIGSGRKKMEAAYDKIKGRQDSEKSRVLKTRLGTAGAAVGTTGLGAYALTRKKDGDK